jgi:branched-chain amino acid transport system ATP-binding protein
MPPYSRGLDEDTTRWSTTESGGVGCDANELRLQSVSAGYGQQLVLEDVSFVARVSGVTCILGKNGTGKSTLLGVISGSIQLARGSIVFGGCDISQCSTRRRLELGLVHVLQGRSLFKDMTVRENLFLGGYIVRSHKVVRTRIDAVCETLPALRKWMGTRAGLLSGGEQRIVEIGRALVAGPKYLLLDEPSIGLAPNTRVAVFEMLARVAGNGVGMLIVEQNARAALSISDSCVVLGNGRVARQVAASELRSDAALRGVFEVRSSVVHDP